MRELYGSTDERLAARRDRPDLDVRRRPAHADPRQGPRADRALSPSGSRGRATSSRITCSSSGRRALDRVPAARDAPGRVRRARLPRRARPGRTTALRRRVRARAARRAAGVASAYRADRHAGDEGDDGHDENIDREDEAAAVRRGPLGLRGRRRSRSSVAAATRREARDHPRRHEVRVRHRRRRRSSLGDEALTPDSSRFWPARRYAPGGPQPSFDKQFVRDYCRVARLGQHARPGRSCPTSRRRDSRALRRGVRAADRRSRSTRTSPDPRWCS